MSLIAAAVLTAGPVLGQAPPNPQAVAAAIATGGTDSQGVAAIVNDRVISDYDVNQRTALYVATSGIRPTPEAIADIRRQVLRALEDETLQLQEAAKREIKIERKEIDEAIQEVAQDNQLTAEQLTATLAQAGVSVETFSSQIGAQLAWNKLVSARYGGSIRISDEAVEAAMQRIREGADKPQFLVSEIYFAVDRPEDEAQARTSADQILQQINLGAPFPAVARQFSQSASAAGGGDIGWVQKDQLPDDLDAALAELRPGQVAGPIRAEGGYYLLLLRDRREPAGTVIPEVPQGTQAGPVPLDRLLLPLPPEAPEDLQQQAMQFAVNLRGRVRSCDQLAGIAKDLPGAVYVRLGTIDPSQLSPDIREALAQTEPGQSAMPILSPAGVELIVRCDSPVQKLVAFQMPTRDEVTQQLFMQQMTVMARSYLRDLRRDAVVETR